MEPLFKTKINGCVYESLGIAGYFPVTRPKKSLQVNT